MLNLKLYMLQRLTALVMAPLAVGHIAVMTYAVQRGLSAGEILSRTQGSFAWAAFYGTFAVAVSIHAAIGMRVVAAETFGLRGSALTALTWLVFIALLSLGLYAVFSVTAP